MGNTTKFALNIKKTVETFCVSKHEYLIDGKDLKKN
jgi:hypothetical protein